MSDTTECQARSMQEAIIATLAALTAILGVTLTILFARFVHQDIGWAGIVFWAVMVVVVVAAARSYITNNSEVER